MEAHEKEDPILTELKQKFKGRITTFIVPLDQDEDEETPNRKVSTIYLKNPDKKVRDMISTLMNKGKVEAAIISGLKALRIGGDEISVIESNDYALISAEVALVQHLSVAKTIIKKN